MTLQQRILFGELGTPTGPDRWVSADRQLGWTAGWVCGCSGFTYDVYLEPSSEWHVYQCADHEHSRRDLAASQFVVPVVIFRASTVNRSAEFAGGPPRSLP